MATALTVLVWLVIGVIGIGIVLTGLTWVLAFALTYMASKEAKKEFKSFEDWRDGK